MKTYYLFAYHPKTGKYQLRDWETGRFITKEECRKIASKAEKDLSQSNL